MVPPVRQYPSPEVRPVLRAEDVALEAVEPARLSPKQVEDLADLRRHTSYGLWHEVGVGKTHPTAYRLLEVVAPGVGDVTFGERRRAIVVMKRSILRQWVEKIHSLVLGYRAEHPEWAGVTVGILTGGQKPEVVFGRTVPDIVLVNYDYIPMIRPWLDSIIDSVAALVLDEAHKVKGFRGFRSNKGVRARHLMELGPQVPLRYALSGSPVLKPESSDVWALYHFLDPTIFGASRWRFVQEFFYNVSHDHRYERLVLKPGAGTEISRRMYLIAKRRLKRESPGEFPVPRRLPYYVEMPRAVEARYRELERTMITTIDGAPITRVMLLSRLMALQQIASGFLLDNGRAHCIDASHKWEQVVDILDEVGDEPVVVWAHFRHEIEWLSKELDRIGRRNVIAYGEMGSKLDENVDAFKRGAVNTIVGQPATVGAGMDFQRAQHSIRFSRSYINEDFIQSEGRTNRAFSAFDETVHHEIVTAETRDQEVYDALIHGRNLADTITLDFVAPPQRNIG